MPENVEPEPQKGGQEDGKDLMYDIEEPPVDISDKHTPENTFSC